MIIEGIDTHKIRSLFTAETVLISWLSFENRSVAVLSELLSSGTPGNVIVVRHKDPEYELSSHVKSVRTKAKRLIRLEKDLARGSQFATADALKELLGSCLSQYQKVFIDISCFPREAVLMLTFILEGLESKDRCYLLYNIAQDYSIDEPDIKRKWLGKGLKKISPVIGYSGVMLPGKPLALIGLLGMDEDRFVRMVDALEPASLYIGIARSDSPSWQWLTNNSFDIAEKLSGSTPNSRVFSFDCESIEKTIRAISGVHSAIANMNVCLITLNNKFSTIAAGLYSLRNRDVQICSAPALIYNYAAYSKESEEFQIVRASDLFTA